MASLRPRALFDAVSILSDGKCADCDAENVRTADTIKVSNEDKNLVIGRFVTKGGLEVFGNSLPESKIGAVPMLSAEARKS